MNERVSEEGRKGAQGGKDEGRRVKLVSRAILTTEPRDRGLYPPACRTQPPSWFRGGCTRCSSYCPLGGAPERETGTHTFQKYSRTNVVLGHMHMLFCPWKLEIVWDCFRVHNELKLQLSGGVGLFSSTLCTCRSDQQWV